ncbi:50S ribosomal protein L15 [Mesomycoplasma lagogenitalium]|uniref:Large ribosomal subunit protein uL15 n=1 Tax=Mesomycoplasma lagogenitalium TaxID=171286 RepID=A0ABY8LV08_9BACT|nr:50S ribosomal protein L15 [Mesomycoplasma lagogenitalium]WGI36570.1 50S ribosomal protein L15 [Mesomycoplasma lagogenitalium]
MSFKLHSLVSSEGSRKEKHRKGRGHAAGKGKQAGKGQSGQKKRGSVRPGFEGGQNPLFRRLPKIGFNNINKIEYQIVSLAKLEQNYNDGDKVSLESLFEKRLVRRKTMPVKLLASGSLTKKLTIEVNSVSTTAKEVVEKLGGTVNLV